MDMAKRVKNVKCSVDRFVEAANLRDPRGVFVRACVRLCVASDVDEWEGSLAVVKNRDSWMRMCEKWCICRYRMLLISYYGALRCIVLRNSTISP
jgi:hypothetical protein